MVGDAFDLADKYRNPAMLLTDAVIGQNDGAGRA